MHAARIMPCDSISKFISQDRVSKFDQWIQLYYKLNRRNVVSLTAMNGANNYMGQSRRSYDKISLDGKIEAKIQTRIAFVQTARIS